MKFTQSCLTVCDPMDYTVQGLNPGLLHCRFVLYQLSYQGSPNKLPYLRLELRTFRFWDWCTAYCAKKADVSIKIKPKRKTSWQNKRRWRPPSIHLLYQSAETVILSTLGLHDRNLIPRSSGGWKSKIKVLAGLVPSEGQEGRICSRPVPLVYRWLSSSWVFTSPSLSVS